LNDGKGEKRRGGKENSTIKRGGARKKGGEGKGPKREDTQLQNSKFGGTKNTLGEKKGGKKRKKYSLQMIRRPKGSKNEKKKRGG